MPILGSVMAMNTLSIWRIASSGIILCVLLLLSGCFETFKAGGAPQLSFNVDGDIQKLTTQFQSTTDITEFYKIPSQNARDQFITGRLALIDLRYLQFIRSLTSDKQQIDSATDIASLTLNLAGTLVGGARAKTNLAAAAAGLGGAKTSVDKNFYYEKSVDALVATMNAKRKEVLTRILQSIGSSLNAYSLTHAVTDVHEYYLAGTINGAITFIQAQATEREKASDIKLENLQIVRDVALLPIEDRASKQQLTRSVGAPDLTQAKANEALRALGLDEQKLPADLEKSKAVLQEYVKQARTVEDIRMVKRAFEQAQIFKAN